MQIIFFALVGYSSTLPSKFCNTSDDGGLGINAQDTMEEENFAMFTTLSNHMVTPLGFIDIFLTISYKVLLLPSLSTRH